MGINNIETNKNVSNNQPKNTMAEALGNVLGQNNGSNKNFNQGENTQNRLSWDSIGDNILNIGYADTNQTLTEIKKHLTEYCMEDLAKKYDINFELIPKSSSGVTSGIAVDIILLILKFQGTDGKTYLFDYAFILPTDPEEVPLANRQKIGGYNSVTSDLLVLSSDYYDANMITVINKTVKQSFNRNIDVYKHVDAVVIAPDFDFTDKVCVQNLLKNALLAINKELEEIFNFPDINIAAINLDKSQNQVVNFSIANDRTIYDSAGMPVRADVIVDMSLNKNPGQSNEISPNVLLERHDEKITSAAGFIDVIYCPENNTNVNPTNNQTWLSGNNINNMTSLRKYQAMFVLTSLFCTKKQSLGGTLLSLINASAFIENNYWIEALRPNRMLDIPLIASMRDIGNLGYEIPNPNNESGRPEKFATDPAKFTNEMFYRFIETYFYNKVVIAIDIPEAGADSWLLDDIYTSAIAGDSEEANNAQGRIVNTLNCLTNGNFTKRYDNREKMFTPIDTKIILGQYGSKDNPRDVRDLDYIAVAGHAGDSNDMSLLESWSNYYFATNIGLNQKIGLANKVLKSALPNYNPVSYARRIIVNPSLIVAIQQALKDCGYTYNAQQYNVNNINDKRAYAQYMSGFGLGASQILNNQSIPTNRGNFNNSNFGRSSIL